MAYILGKKIGMTRMYNEREQVIPVTLIEAGPVHVVSKRTADKDGYDAVQVGFGVRNKISKALEGHLKRANIEAKLRVIREVEPSVFGDFNVGDEVKADVFEAGDVVKVSGLSKAKGFQGGVKRHGFAGMPASHGHHHVLRHPGSIGQRFPQHTLKGMRMAGRMGGLQTTARGLTVMAIDIENNILAVKGAVPGRRGTIIEIQKIK